jgi:hypothetical protein
VLFYFLPGMRDTETPGNTSRVILSEPVEVPGGPSVGRTDEPLGEVAR